MTCRQTPEPSQQPVPNNPLPLTVYTHLSNHAHQVKSELYKVKFSQQLTPQEVDLKYSFPFVFNSRPNQHRMKDGWFFHWHGDPVRETLIARPNGPVCSRKPDSYLQQSRNHSVWVTSKSWCSYLSTAAASVVDVLLCQLVERLATYSYLWALLRGQFSYSFSTIF